VIPMRIELDFSGVHGVEAVANDLADIKRRFGQDITLIGNMDINFLGYASEEEIRQATREMLVVGARGGRYVASCTSGPEGFIPLENYLAFVEEIHAFVPELAIP
jgi:uroporphyrinogen-III decarboxylase